MILRFQLVLFNECQHLQLQFNLKDQTKYVLQRRQKRSDWILLHNSNSNTIFA